MILINVVDSPDQLMGANRAAGASIQHVDYAYVPAEEKRLR